MGALRIVLWRPPRWSWSPSWPLIAFLLAGWRVALFTVLGLVLIISLGLWEEAMLTLALVLAATVIGAGHRHPDRDNRGQVRAVEAVVMPVLDIDADDASLRLPGARRRLLGLGDAPALIATVIFAMPPAVRLTMLGIQQVPKETVEAAHAFGSTPWQTLSRWSFRSRLGPSWPGSTR